MALTTNNQRAEELANELARLTGMSATAAIIMALETELDDRDPDEFLYDENRLPH